MLSTRFSNRRTLWILSTSLLRRKNRTNLWLYFGSKSAIENCVKVHNTNQHKGYLTCSSIHSHKSDRHRLAESGLNDHIFSRTYSSALFTPSAEGEQAAFILKPEINFELLRSRMVDIENAVTHRNMDVHVNPKEVVRF